VCNLIRPKTCSRLGPKISAFPGASEYGGAVGRVDPVGSSHLETAALRPSELEQFHFALRRHDSWAIPTVSGTPDLRPMTGAGGGPEVGPPARRKQEDPDRWVFFSGATRVCSVMNHQP